MVGHSGVLAAQVKPYFETHQLGLVWVAVAVVAAVIELVGGRRRRTEGTQRDRGSLLVLRICVAPGVLLMGLAPRLVPNADIRPPLVSLTVGIVLFVCGEALRVWSKVALGRYFTYSVHTSTDQPVIAAGPYRVLRHPSYTGIMLMVIGLGAVWGNWAGLVAVTVLTMVGLSYRIRVEERALLADLGDRYEAFAAHRKRLIPYVW
jgi:protein-S-isoprenylcysteine O-methyltransferase Ste14